MARQMSLTLMSIARWWSGLEGFTFTFELQENNVTLPGTSGNVPATGEFVNYPVFAGVPTSDQVKMFVRVGSTPIFETEVFSLVAGKDNLCALVSGWIGEIFASEWYFFRYSTPLRHGSGRTECILCILQAR